MHDGFDRRKQAVKMTDVFGIEKVGGSIYENNREHGTVTSPLDGVTSMGDSDFKIF